MKLIQGDLFAALPTDRNVIIPHVCNNIGGWGAGFVVPLSRKWPRTKTEYYKKNKLDGLKLGQVQFVKVEDKIIVANMIAQEGLIGPTNPVPLKYEALEACLEQVADYAKTFDTEGNLEIHAPKFGSGLAGGDWNKIEPIILRTLSQYPITIYYL